MQHLPANREQESCTSHNIPYMRMTIVRTGCRIVKIGHKITVPMLMTMVSLVIVVNLFSYKKLDIPKRLIKLGRTSILLTHLQQRIWDRGRY